MTGEDKNNRSQVMAAAAMGFEIIAIAFAGLFFGDIIDKRLGTSGYGTLGLLTVLFAGWFIRFLRHAKRVEREEEEKEKLDKDRRDRLH